MRIKILVSSIPIPIPIRAFKLFKNFKLLFYLQGTTLQSRKLFGKIKIMHLVGNYPYSIKSAKGVGGVRKVAVFADIQ